MTALTNAERQARFRNRAGTALRHVTVLRKNLREGIELAAAAEWLAKREGKDDVAAAQRAALEAMWKAYDEGAL